MIYTCIDSFAETPMHLLARSLTHTHSRPHSSRQLICSQVSSLGCAHAELQMHPCFAGRGHHLRAYCLSKQRWPPLQINSEFQTFKHIECLAPGELMRAHRPLEATVAIHPTLVLTNALPYDMDIVVWQVQPVPSSPASVQPASKSCCRLTLSEHNR